MSEAVAPASFNRLLSDERLTRRAVGGDEHAFGAIFRRYHQPLYRFCLAIVGNPEDAQDALQNTMMKVLRALPGEEREIELKPWLYRIAHNESIDLLRRRRETRQLDAEQAAPGYGLTEDAATRERLRRLLADIQELPDRQREVLVMRELAGLGFDEIGGALETSSGTVRQTLYEARLSLRQMEEGREMGCDEVTRALSDGDGRVIRRRDVRAHLRACTGCRGFREEIKGRRQDLAALSPLPAVAAAGMLQGLVGSQAAGGTGLAAALGSGAAKTIATSAAAKGVATVAVVAAVGVGTADRTGVIHLGLPGEGGSQSSTKAPGAADVGPGKSARGGHPGEAGSDGAGAGTSGSYAHGKVHAGAASEVPAPSHPHGKDRGHEKGWEGGQPGNSGGERGGGRQAQLPEAAGGGGSAAGPKGEPSAGGKTAPETAGPKPKTESALKPKPETAPSSSHPPPGGPAEAPSKGAAENPPQGAAPEAPPQAHQPQPSTKAPEAPPQGAPASAGGSAEAPGRQPG